MSFQLTLHLNGSKAVLALDAMTIGRQRTIVENMLGNEPKEVVEEIEVMIQGKFVQGSVLPPDYERVKAAVDTAFADSFPDTAMPREGYTFGEKTERLLRLLQTVRSSGFDPQQIEQVRSRIDEIAESLGCNNHLEGIRIMARKLAVEAEERKKSVAAFTDKVSALAQLVGSEEAKLTSIIETLQPKLERLAQLERLDELGLLTGSSHAKAKLDSLARVLECDPDLDSCLQQATEAQEAMTAAAKELEHQRHLESSVRTLMTRMPPLKELAGEAKHAVCTILDELAAGRRPDDEEAALDENFALPADQKGAPAP